MHRVTEPEDFPAESSSRLIRAQEAAEPESPDEESVIAVVINGTLVQIEASAATTARTVLIRALKTGGFLERAGDRWSVRVPGRELDATDCGLTNGSMLWAFLDVPNGTGRIVL